MRQRVGGVIIENGLVLTEKRVKNGETYWVFPGGGVDEGENHKQALIRECMEELGVTVEVGKLLHEEFFKPAEYAEQKEFFYECKVVGGKLGTGTGPEWDPNSKYEGLREIEWLEISKLNDLDLRPIEMKKLLIR